MLFITQYSDSRIQYVVFSIRAVSGSLQSASSCRDSQSQPPQLRNPDKWLCQEEACLSGCNTTTWPDCLLPGTSPLRHSCKKEKSVSCHLWVLVKISLHKPHVHSHSTSVWIWTAPVFQQKSAWIVFVTGNHPSRGSPVMIVCGQLKPIALCTWTWPEKLRTCKPRQMAIFKV